MHFAERTPSVNWEAVPLAGGPQYCFWVWIKPPAAPQGIAIQVPAELLQDPACAPSLTLRCLVRSMGIDPRDILSGSLLGYTYEALQGANPAWDYPIPPPPPGVDSTITLLMGSPQRQSSVSSRDLGPLLHLEAEWNASLQIEMDLTEAERLLNATALRIKTLNRDLTVEEARVAGNLERRDWTDARRWLREASNRLSRFIKDQRIGSAGSTSLRQRCEAIMENYVVPRRSFEGMQQAIFDFESYNKSLSTLLNNMKAVQAYATQDAERRAQQVLTRLAAKVRAARAKR